MSRYKAASIHLLISVLLLGSVIGTIFWVWYPEPTFEVLGAFPMIRLLVGVTLVIGPLLTLVVYKHGKPGLKFDLTVIVLLQIAVLLYGSYGLYDEKPHFMVFAVDRLEFIPEKQVDVSAIRFDELRTKRFAKLVQVFARAPEDPAAYQRYFDSVMIDGKPDLERRAEFYEPWTAGADVIREKVKPVGDINPASGHERENINRAIKRHSDAHPNLGILPIGGIERNAGMLLDMDTLEILDVLDANPW